MGTEQNQSSEMLKIARVDNFLREKGIIVVIGKQHVMDTDGHVKPEYVSAAVNGIWKAGLPAELTFRIPVDILRDARRSISPHLDGPAINQELSGERILGIGSVAGWGELEAAMEMEFDFVVSPASGVGGARYEGKDGKLGAYKDPSDLVRWTRAKGIFSAPAAFTPQDISFYLFRDDGLRPDALKIFNSELLAPNEAKALSGLLAPFARDDGEYQNRGFIIMPAGGVTAETAPYFVKSIIGNGFFPVLGMSDPIGKLKGKATAKSDAYYNEVRAFLQRYNATYRK